MKQFETVTFKGTAVHTNGMMPQKGEMAPDFTAVAGDLSELSLGSLKAVSYTHLRGRRCRYVHACRAGKGRSECQWRLECIC